MLQQNTLKFDQDLMVHYMDKENCMLLQFSASFDILHVPRHFLLAVCFWIDFVVLLFDYNHPANLIYKIFIFYSLLFDV